MPKNRMVIKIGTNVITSKDGHLDKAHLASLCLQITNLHKSGFQVLIVTSGAIGSGRAILKVSLQRRDVPGRQMLAAVGQSLLMSWYQSYFKKAGINVAQILLTADDLNDRLRYLNVRNTILGLLTHKIIPIINENDVVSYEEIKELQFGDNDTLASMVALLVDAELLLILTDVEGLFTEDPTVSKKAKLINRVEKIDSFVESLAGNSRSGVGSGGMRRKILAARKATAAGIKVIIANGLTTQVVTRVVLKDENLGTAFLPATKHFKGRKRWLLAGVRPKGKVTIDEKAKLALVGNKSLLPVGIIKTEGRFERGEAVSILDGSGERVALGLTNYSMGELEKIKGQRSTNITKILGYNLGEAVVHKDNLVITN